VQYSGPERALRNGSAAVDNKKNRSRHQLGPLFTKLLEERMHIGAGFL